MGRCDSCHKPSEHLIKVVARIYEFGTCNVRKFGVEVNSIGGLINEK